MSDIQLLIIEDEKSQIEAYEDSIFQHNKKHENKIIPIIKRDYKEGAAALKSPDYDGAIIDLKLSNSEELEGKKLVEDVNKKIRIPIIIYSGSIAQVEDIAENILLKKKSRDQVLIKDILLEIENIYDTGITRFLRSNGFIDNMLTTIFWKHLSESLFDLRGNNTEKAVVRYISSHIQEFLEMDGEDGLEDLNPAEFYIYPPIKKQLSTGDVLLNNKSGLYFLLLTPACDILLRNTKSEPPIKVRSASKALLISLVTWNSIENFHTLKEDTGTSNQVRKNLEGYIQNKKKERFHFLPPYKNLKGFFADFQSQNSLDFDELGNTCIYERIATISQPFLKDIIARFSQYYSRQGQPELLQDKVYTALIAQNPK